MHLVIQQTCSSAHRGRTTPVRATTQHRVGWAALLPIHFGSLREPYTTVVLVSLALAVDVEPFSTILPSHTHSLFFVWEQSRELLPPTTPAKEPRSSFHSVTGDTASMRDLGFLGGEA